MDIFLKDILTLIIAIAALVLGIINTRHAMWRDKIKLGIAPGMTPDPTGRSNIPALTVTVTNLSYISVTLAGVSLALKGEEEIISPPVVRSLPMRLEPRSSHTVLFPHFVTEEPHPRLADATHISARTECGHTVRCKFNPSRYLS